MKLSDLFDYDSMFRQKSEILDVVARSKNFKGEDLNAATVSKFFETSKQRTYLITTDQMVYCVLDDRRKREPVLSWSEKLENFTGLDRFNSSITVDDKTDKTGVVNFGARHNGWLYSKNLFPDGDIKADLAQAFRIDQEP